MPRVPVAQLRLDVRIRKQQFLLREKNVTTTRMGSLMLRVLLGDRTGAIPGVLFDVPSHVVASLSVGRGVEVSGRIGEYRDQLQVSIERIEPTELADLEELLPAARRPLQEMKQEFDELLQSVQDSDLKRLLDAIFGDPETYRAFSLAPAAKFNHHACVGGLLEHTLSVARLVLAACDSCPELDRDMAVAVALLHDLGKIRAYDRVSFDLTEEGSLWTHLYMGASRVEHAIDGLPGFDSETKLRAVHAILAHHGSRDAGSPVLPMTLEALVVHHADHLDSDVRGAIDQMKRTEEDGGAFTERSFMHDTRLYRGTRSRSSDVQQSLW